MTAEVIPITGPRKAPEDRQQAFDASAYVSRAFVLIGIACDPFWAERFVEALRESGAGLVPLTRRNDGDEA